MSFKKDLSKFKPRKEQQLALDFIDQSYKSNPLNKYYLLDLPVGTGKSHLAIMIADWYRKNVNRTSKIDIITNSKILQDQYSKTYNSISDFKGKRNYDCKNYACSCEQGAEFNKLNKTKCDFCPYKDAKDSYVTSVISLTNFHLFILYSMYNEKFMESRNSSVLIVDECHDFDDVMSDFISIKITEKLVKKYKFDKQTDILKRLKLVKSIDSYIDFLNYFLKEIISNVGSFKKEISVKRDEKTDKRSLIFSKILEKENIDVKKMKLITSLSQLGTKIEIFLKEYNKNKDNWTIESNYNEKTKQKELSIEPIWAYDYLDSYVFSGYDMVFFMSGTIIDKELFCYLNGIDEKLTEYYSIPSPFDVKSRPIYYLPLGKMTYSEKENTFKNYIPYIKKILNKYKGKKGIIHTNSFELANWIKNEIKDPRLLFHDSTNKDEVLRFHIKSDKPTVIVSPSMGTGVSFDNDTARFQIIAKIPYPSLGSNKNKLRQKNNSKWYSWKTSATLQQSCGRIVRSSDDYGDTIIIDSSFGDIMKYNSHLLPDWFINSIKKIKTN